MGIATLDEGVNIAAGKDTSPAVANQKKRALEALERRFASAKPEILHDYHKNKKNRTLQEGRGGEGKGEGEEEASFTSLEPPTSAKKGHFAFYGHTPHWETPGVADQEAQHSAYFKLCQPVHKNLDNPGLNITSSGVNAVNRIVHDLLQSGDSAQKYMQGSRKMKIDNWLLLDRFVPKSDASMAARVKALQSHSKRSKRHMSLRQHRKCGSFDLPEKFHKFDLFKPMHEMWKEYIVELIKTTGKDHLVQCLLSADLHGAILLVVECKTMTFVGVHGIMIRETAETFGIITQENKFRVVPKKGSVFIFKAGYWKITLYGDMLSSRNIGP